ncbi:MAG: hypothetical protein WCB18_03985 [Thermoplasmata archaeon]
MKFAMVWAPPKVVPPLLEAKTLKVPGVATEATTNASLPRGELVRATLAF